MTYKEQLLDNRWKLKRDSILKRDEKQCQHCESSKNLQVHHKYYKHDLMAWQYPDEALITLCKNCHQEEEEKLRELSSTIFMSLRKCGFDADLMSCLIGSFENISKKSFSGASEITELLNDFSRLPKTDRTAIAQISEKLIYANMYWKKVTNG